MSTAINILLLFLDDIPSLPPGVFRRITEDGIRRITEDNKVRITE